MFIFSLDRMRATSLARADCPPGSFWQLGVTIREGDMDAPPEGNCSLSIQEDGRREGGVTRDVRKAGDERRRTAEKPTVGCISRWCIRAFSIMALPFITSSRPPRAQSLPFVRGEKAVDETSYSYTAVQLFINAASPPAALMESWRNPSAIIYEQCSSN